MPISERIRRAAAIRDGEGDLVVRIALVFGLLETGRGLGEVGATTLLVTRDVGALPAIYIPLGLILMAAAILYGAGLGRFRRAPLFGATLAAVAAALIVEWLLLDALPSIVAVAWLTVMAAGYVGLTVGWTVASSTLDARQAKRLFPLCTAAAIGGAFVGNLAGGVIGATIGAAVLLPVQAAFLVAAAFVIRSVAARSTAVGWAPPRRSERSVLDDVRVGFDEVRASPLLRLVAVAYVLFAVLGFSVNFPFLLETRAAFPDEAEFARITAIIGAVIAAISLVVALVVANRFYARFGVAAAALLLPLVYVVGFSIWLGWFSFPTAALVVVAQQSTQRGLSNAAWSAFYNIVPAAKRAQVLAFQDGVPGQVGTILSGVLLLVAGGTAALEPVFGLGLVAALVCTVVVIAIRRRYAEALLRTLRSGVGEQVLEGGPGLGELLRVPDVRSALVAALSAPEAGTRSLAASLLARSPTPDARAALAGVFEDPDPEVRAIAAAAVLQETDRGPEEARAEQCLVRLSTGDADERAAGLRAIHRLGRDLPPGDRAVFLSDPDPSVRAMTMVVLSRASDEAATSALVDGLGDPEPIVRRAASAALAARPASDPRVVARLSDPSDDVQAAAIAALDGHGATAGDAVRSWAARRVARATDLREACRALRISSSTIEVADDGSTDFLLFTLDERVARHESMALLAMSVLGAPAGPGVIRRTLRSRDPDVRAQAIEALDSVGDRRLGSSIATLVEGGGPSGSGADPATTLRRLRDDDDPWIRGLAARVGTNGVEMADAARSLGDIDTMLRLRRVPLFARLSPEDLQRVAMVATERVFEPDATIVREGDDGDELYVILEGRVVVTRLEPDGSERRVRTYEAGDHFGELAVLREAPRAATVSADGVTVRTLVVAGDGLASILRERPDAAMAMLATLAERISVQ